MPPCSEGCICPAHHNRASLRGGMHRSQQALSDRQRRDECILRCMMLPSYL